MTREIDGVSGFRNRRGDEAPFTSVTASAMKNELARALEMAGQGTAVVITKHDVPKAVLLSVDEFNALATASARRLETLSEEFDALLARMQTKEARAGMEEAFGASPAELGRAAVSATRKRG